jgi:hypothetical protein
MIMPSVIAQEIAMRTRASYGFMFRFAQITSSGATPRCRSAIRYGEWCVRAWAARCAAICWLNSTKALFNGGYVCPCDSGPGFSASGWLLPGGGRPGCALSSDVSATSLASVMRRARRPADVSTISARAHSMESTFLPTSGRENGRKLTGRRCVGRLALGTSCSARDTFRSVSAMEGSVKGLSSGFAGAPFPFFWALASAWSFLLRSFAAVFMSDVSALSSVPHAFSRRWYRSGMSLRSRFSQTLATPPGR